MQNRENYIVLQQKNYNFLYKMFKISKITGIEIFKKIIILCMKLVCLFLRKILHVKNGSITMNYLPDANK